MDKMKVPHRTLLIIAALVCYSGGIALLIKGGSLIKGAYLMDSQSVWAITASLSGAVAGLLKGRFLFRRNCEKNIKRIKSLSSPRLWQFFRPGMLIFLAIIIPTGAWMSKSAAGNYTLLCLVGALDLSIAFALLTSSTAFWKLKVFSTAEN